MITSGLDLATMEDLVIYLLILWATTGLTIIHLAVLGYQLTKRGIARLRGGRRTPETAAAPADEPVPDLSMSFLVAVYNEGLTVGPCIDSILSQSVRPKQIIFVNDGSTDDTGKVLESYREKGITVIHMPRNSGKAYALEEGLKHVTTDLVAITDADSVVDKEYTREILKAFRDPDVVGVGGAVESIPHTWITAARQVEYMMTVGVNRNAEHHMKSLVVLPGVSTTYRTQVLRKMGYDHDTIAEDFDLTFRLHKAGHKIAFNTKAKVYTSDPPTLKAYYRQIHRWNTDFWMVVKKHRDVLGKKMFGTVEVPMILLNTTLSSVLFLGLPIYFAIFDPARLPAFLLAGTTIDVALVILAHRIYKRTDVYWSLLSRYPTRFAARFAFLLAMVQVICGRPGMAWKKLERRRVDNFLHSMNGSAPATAVVPPTAEEAPPAPGTPGAGRP